MNYLRLWFCSFIMNFYFSMHVVFLVLHICWCLVPNYHIVPSHITLNISLGFVHSLYWYCSVKVYVPIAFYIFYIWWSQVLFFVVFLCWKIRHPKFRRVINLSSCIHWDVYWKTRDFVAYIPCPKLYWTQYFCLRICLGQTRISYYS